jgi:hypothetical protein
LTRGARLPFEEANQAHQFVDTMLEDFRIMEHHPHWRDRINDMADFAVKESVLALREETGDSAALTVKPLAEHVIAALNLSDDDSSAEVRPPPPPPRHRCCRHRRRKSTAHACMSCSCFMFLFSACSRGRPLRMRLQRSC